MATERTCETCRWYRGQFVCCHYSVAFGTDKERQDMHSKACGPSGRYWEPKESEVDNG